jgi:hypothetical protein
VASLRLRWSEHEARKPYARPFMVSFLDDGGEAVGSVGMNGPDLLYWRQFGAAVAGLCGELFILERVGGAPDPQRAWLDTLEPLLPAAKSLTITPHSTFDHDHGRVFGFVVGGDGGEAVVDASTLLEYQDFQASLAHQTGRLLRVGNVEAVADADARRQAWLGWLGGLVDRPGPDEAMSPHWPWR